MVLKLYSSLPLLLHLCYFQVVDGPNPSSVKDECTDKEEKENSSKFDSLGFLSKYKKSPSSKVKKIRNCKLCSSSGHDRRKCPLRS